MSATSLVQGVSKRLYFPPVVVTRPNNTTAYGAAGGQIWGDGTDARIALPVPSAPFDLTDAFTLSYQIVHSRPSGDTISGWYLLLFGALPPTVLKDQDACNLSDADIALILPQTSNMSGLVSTSSNSGSLNNGVGIAGRRLVGGSPGQIGGALIPPGGMIYAYLKTFAAAYTPVANEKLLITPIWSYTGVPLT